MTESATNNNNSSIASTSKQTLEFKPNPSSVASRARLNQPPTKINKVPFFSNAAQPEIVRANQKDLYYLSQLTEQFEDVSRSLLGTRWLQRWSQELGQGSRLAYFGLTTLLGSQTLGEEYCDILQYSVQNRKPPTQRRRAILLALHIIVPYLISKIYASTRRALLLRHATLEEIKLQNASLDSLFSTSPPPPSINKFFLTRWLDGITKYALDIPTFETLTEDYLRSIHLAIFYLSGRYYNLSKRSAGIRFISTQAERSPSSSSSSSVTPPSSYEVLGVLMAFQLIIRTFLSIRHRRQATAALLLSSLDEKKKTAKKLPTFMVDGQPLSSLIFDPDDPDQASPYPIEVEDLAVGGGGRDRDRDRRCTLCLGTRRDPSVTECGHVFCWECIVGWTREKSECPLCRQNLNLNKLLPILNI